uniref:DNA ligase IV n=1 Tax=Ditylenchus dipsaci TaxID=166011 RepID=A0A915ECJ1_9BILA
MAELVSQKILFVDLCNTLQRIKQSYRIQHRRLFLPCSQADCASLDDARKFAIKELRLNTLVSLFLHQILSCKINSSIPSELLVEKLISKIEDRVPCKNENLSIYQINQILDRLKDSQQKTEELNSLFRSCSPIELRYIFHLLICDTERVIGVPHPSTILSWFHKEADSRLKTGDNLQEVCDAFSFEDPGDDTDAEGMGKNLLCKTLQPMLLKRLNYNKECLPKIIKYCQRPFYLELKFDGEHILLHKYCTNSYKYFTRNGIDYTNKLGPDSGSKISAKIHPFFKSTVKDCVLDCELLIWDTKSQTFVGKSRRASDGNVYDAKHMDEDFFDNSDLQRSLVVFDVLFLNGRSLINLPLQERMAILKERVLEREDKSIIFDSEKTLVQTAQEFANFYNKAMREGEEGIVVKGLQTIYKTGSRAERNGWFKIKPDYGIQALLDLAVVGVNFENNSTNVKSFLVAARQSGAEDLKFRIVAGITSHIKKLDFVRLMELLKGDEQLLSSDSQPDWLASQIKPDKKLKIVPRQNIQVVEVRASGIINGRLQFPSIVGIRTDKLLEEIDITDDVRGFDQRIRSRPLINADDKETVVLQNKKRRNELKIKQDCQILKSDATSTTITDSLKDHKVCVLNGNEQATVQDLQKILLSLGAQLVANAGRTTSFVVAMNEKHIKCVAAIKADQWHVVSGNWLLRCRDANKLVSWDPSEDMIYKCPNANFDLFNCCEEEEGDDQEVECDHENEATEKEEEDVENDQSASTSNPKAQEQNFTGEDCAACGDGNLFEQFVFFIHSKLPTSKVAELTQKIEQQQGKVAARLDAMTTHAVIPDRMKFGEAENLFHWNEAEKDWLGIFVSSSWIDQAIAEENRYLVGEALNNFLC